ncbi:MAG: D-aminoacyl-tRNA deacylase [Candidatus Hodarchaeales archaeon]|jgi:D-aminoacyl-tRNA deacylase
MAIIPLPESKVLLFASRKDIAGMNILDFLDSNLKDKVFIFEIDSINSDDEISRHAAPGTSCIFLSRHRAKSLKPSFTVHPVGNFNQALVGGKVATLCPCDSFTLKRLLLNVNKLINTGEYNLSHHYEISIEATHHGPSSTIPVAFIEVGSSETQWQEKEACKLIADAVNLFFKEKKDLEDEWVPAIAFGSNHYSSKFSRLVLETENALGHVCAKYAISSLNADLVRQMIEKTIPRPVKAFFDRKSLKRKQEIRGWLAEHGIEVVQI